MKKIIKENRANGKEVLRSEYKSSREVVVTYTDFSKHTFSDTDYKTMHKDVKT